jgi:glyoxylase-like metal-dependent hydrolase (beta-lactamase superfamily II)
MPHYICVTCATQYPDSPNPPEGCPICQDDRQYIGWDGQQWTTLEAMRESHQNVVRDEEPNLTGIGIEPRFAIGTRALLVQTPGGNILWDSIPMMTEATIADIKARGGLKAIAISHPHFYTAMVEWSKVFDAPVYLHEDNRPWVMRPDPAVHYWHGETYSLGEGLTIIRCGGHFPGSSALHWADGADGRGVLLTGDTILVAQDRRYVTFMYSYPNLIPLNAAAVNRIVSSVEPFAFERLYGGWWGSVVSADAKGAVERSAARYIRAISDTP